MGERRTDYKKMKIERLTGEEAQPTKNKRQHAR